MDIKKLVLCGESWAWGYELIDPAIEDKPLHTLNYNTYTARLNKSEFFDLYGLYDKVENTDYRIKNRYAGLLTNMLGIIETVDLSHPGVSNQYIERMLLTWLSEEGYLKGKDAKDILVFIGWTSPERREFTKRDGKPVHFGPWNLKFKYGEDYVDDFIKSYVAYFSSEKESAVRYFMQVLQVQRLLESLNIKYVMHQTFYDNMHWQKLEDIHTRSKTFKSLSKAELGIFDSIDDRTFIHKTNTAANYLRTQNEHCYFKEHPNETGHKKLASYFHKEIIDRNIL